MSQPPRPSSSQQPQQSQQYEVQLAIYDLSQGMARQLSGQFLGPEHALDIIPHTGIRIYGKEYYFGGGIQCASNPVQFQASTGLMPIQVQSLGYTTTDRATFEVWCVQQQQYPHGRFTVTSYDLLHRNCNHFCDEAALHGLHMSQGVPHWILDVPRRFLASPMGQLIRPILEQMQITGTSPVVSGSISSIGAWGNSSGAVPPPSTSNMPNVVVASASTAASSNPWAAAASSSRATTTTIPTTTTTTTTCATTKPNTTTQPKDSSATPVLDLFHKPLVSKDTRSVPVIIRKLSGISSGQDKNQGAASTQALSNLGSLLERSLLSTTATTSTATSDATTTSSSSSSSSSTTEVGSTSSIEAGLTELHHILVVTESSNLAFALMLLRLVVLVVPTKETLSLSSTSTLSPSPMLQIILEWMQDQLVWAGDDDNDGEDSSSGIGACGSGDSVVGSLDQNPAARSMAWCVLSNWVSVIVDMPPNNSNPNQEEPLLMDKQKLIDGAIRDMTASNGQIRQAATCFLYNLALAKTNWTVRFQQQLEHEQQQQKSQGQSSYSSNDGYSENDGILLQDDLLLSILCACVEEFSLLQLLTTSTEVGKEDQYDPTTCLRRLAVIGRILVPVITTGSNANIFNSSTANATGGTKRHLGQHHRCNTAVRQFLLDLGLDQFLKDHVAVAKTPSGTDAKKEKDAIQCRQLATELYKLL